MADVQKIQLVQDNVNKVIKGKEHVVRKVLAAVIAGAEAEIHAMTRDPEEETEEEVPTAEEERLI